MNTQNAVAEVVHAARNAKPPKQNAPKCRYCGAQPMEFYVWRQVFGTPEGPLVILMGCCRSCDREISTAIIAPNPNEQKREIQTPSGLILPR